MRCCSSSFRVAVLSHWRRPRMDVLPREWERELKWFTTGRCCHLTDSVPPLGLTDAEEAISGAADSVYHIDRCAGEPLFLNTIEMESASLQRPTDNNDLRQ
eukprot:g14455.t1